MHTLVRTHSFICMYAHICACVIVSAVMCRQGLNRQVVMSRSAAVSVPSLELEIPVRNGGNALRPVGARLSAVTSVWLDGR